MVNLL
jgi:hypothetical protein